MPKDACYKKVKANWGESSKRKRPVKKKLKNGGYIANGCGSVQESRRKETNNY